MSTTTSDASGTGLNALARHTAVLTGRALRHHLRHLDGLIMGAVLPVMLLVMFVYVFGGALGGDGGRELYIDYVVPAIIVLAAGFSAAQVAVAVTEDLTSGTLDRLRSMAISPAGLLAGHVLANVVRNLGATVVVVLLAVVMGFRPAVSPLAWLGATGITIVFMLAIATVSAMIGVVTRSPEGASGFTFFILFLPYLSSGFVAPETLPTALRGIAEHQPLTPVIDAMRALLLGTPVGSDAWVALLWCGGIVAASVPLTAWLFRRRTSPT